MAGGLAVLTAAVNLALRVDWRAAVAAGVAVAVFDEVLGRFAKPAAAPGPGAPGHGLTRTEVAILREVCRFKTNRQIATERFRAEKTIDRHVENIKNKLGIHGRSGLIVWAREHGICADDLGTRK